MGDSTTISGTAKILDSENLTKEYSLWKSEPITRQKTSNSYSPNIQAGKYKLIAQITPECEDINSSNNKDEKVFEITQSSSTPKILQKSQKNPTLDDFDNTIYSKESSEKRYYNSSSEAAKQIGIISFLVASLLLNIVLIWKR